MKSQSAREFQIMDNDDQLDYCENTKRIGLLIAVREKPLGFINKQKKK